MPRYLPEPSRQPQDSYVAPGIRNAAEGKAGILLVNLGTPDAPTPADVRRYLAEFLSDQRVIEAPRWLWKPVLHGIILRTRPAKSAAKYRAIWTREGSPLLVHTQTQRDMLRGYLGEALRKEGLPVDRVAVEIGMRYGNPSIAHGIDALRRQGCDSLLVLPLYPQYAASTTGSTFDAVATHVQQLRNVPALHLLRSFCDHPAYLSAQAQRAHKFWEREGFPEHLVLSFHGAPEQTYRDGDPYFDECHRTARLLVARLGLKEGQWTLSFQSRFGHAHWLQPYTTEVLAALGRRKVKRVDVICPGFVSDCLETLEEIGMGEKEVFQHAGGGEFRLIPCLNDSPSWISALVEILMPEVRYMLRSEAAPAIGSRKAPHIF